MDFEIGGEGIVVLDCPENMGMKIFGNNQVGEIINDLNPLNLGLADLFKEVDKVTKKEKK